MAEEVIEGNPSAIAIYKAKEIVAEAKVVFTADEYRDQLVMAIAELWDDAFAQGIEAHAAVHPVKDTGNRRVGWGR